MHKEKGRKRKKYLISLRTRSTECDVVEFSRDCWSEIRAKRSSEDFRRKSDGFRSRPRRDISRSEKR